MKDLLGERTRFVSKHRGGATTAWRSLCWCSSRTEERECQFLWCSWVRCFDISLFTRRRRAIVTSDPAHRTAEIDLCLKSNRILKGIYTRLGNVRVTEIDMNVVSKIDRRFGRTGSRCLRSCLNNDEEKVRKRKSFDFCWLLVVSLTYVIRVKYYG